jgi:hypothetical protein
MARERYAITPEDLGFAVSYLSRKLQDGYWLSDDVGVETKTETGIRAFRGEGLPA